MEVNQISNMTIYNRHPEIFQECLDIVGDDKKILSVGCSFYEVSTLKDLYFTNSKIDGVDVSTNIIHELRVKNNNEDLNFYDSFDNIKTLYDLIFCMSILTRNPDPSRSYTFELFEKTLELIDRYLLKDGYLCIWNSKFEFTDTLVSKKYICVDTNHTVSGFTKKVDKYYNPKIKDYRYILFKKIII